MKAFSRLFSQLSIVSLVSLLALTACGGHKETKAQKFVDRLNYSDDDVDFSLSKDPTKHKGVIIVKEKEYILGIFKSTSYYGIDMDGEGFFDDTHNYYEDEKFSVHKVDDGYFEDNDGNLYEKTVEVSKDLSKVRGIVEKLRLRTIGQSLAANYGLSESRGLDLARLFVSYQEVKKSRALTSKDEEHFFNELTGSSLNDVKSIPVGDEASRQDYDRVIEKAALKNGTTPEHVREIFQDFLN